jgi:sRNA-binding carbon storage regulator CsrA
MLVLTRRVGEEIIIGDTRIVAVQNERIQVGIVDAPAILRNSKTRWL